MEGGIKFGHFLTGKSISLPQGRMDWGFDVGWIPTFVKTKRESGMWQIIWFCPKPDLRSRKYRFSMVPPDFGKPLFSKVRKCLKNGQKVTLFGIPFLINPFAKIRQSCPMRFGKNWKKARILSKNRSFLVIFQAQTQRRELENGGYFWPKIWPFSKTRDKSKKGGSKFLAKSAHFWTNLSRIATFGTKRQFWPKP